MHPGALLVAGAVLFVAGLLFIVLSLPVLPPRVRRLNISLHYPLLGAIMANPNIAQKVPFSISPKDADGNVVDLVKFPTALTGIAWSVDNDVASIVSAADGLSADLVPAKVGVVVVSVSGTNVAGEVKTETAAVTFDEVPVPVPVVASLNMAAGEPVAV